MAAAKRKGEPQRKINIQVRGTVGVLVLGGTLLAAVAAVVWTPRAARRRRKEDEDVDTKGDLKLVDVKPNDSDLVNLSSSSSHAQDIRPGEFIAEDADVIQGNGDTDEVDQDNKTCNNEEQIRVEADADIEVHDLASTSGNQSRNIQETKENSEETRKEYPPAPSRSEADEFVVYSGGQVEHQTSSLQYVEEAAELQEQTLPIQYEEDNDLGIEHETSISDEEEEETEVSTVDEASEADAKSETSWDSSVDSTEAAVWPTEMMEKHDIPPLEPIEIEISYYESCKLMENSLELYRKEEEDKHQKEVTETLKAIRLNFNTKREYKGLLLILALALAIGMFSFVHHHQLPGDNVL